MHRKRASGFLGKHRPYCVPNKTAPRLTPQYYNDYGMESVVLITIIFSLICSFLNMHN